MKLSATSALGFSLILLCIFAFGLVKHRHERSQIEKIDFLKWSAENEKKSPFTYSTVMDYLRDMKLNPTEKDNLIVVRYNGLFLEKTWSITPVGEVAGPRR